MAVQLSSINIKHHQNNEGFFDMNNNNSIHNDTHNNFIHDYSPPMMNIIDDLRSSEISFSNETLNSNVINNRHYNDISHIRSRHDSYSSSIYSPGPSSNQTQFVDTYIYETNQHSDYENSHDGALLEVNSLPTRESNSEKKQPREKCMSKNAILARANRQKKKAEAHNMEREIQNLKVQISERDNMISTLKSELDKQTRDKDYYRSLLQNSKELSILVEHLGSKIFPSE